MENGLDEALAIPGPPQPSRSRRRPDYDKFEKYETASASSGGGGGGGRRHRGGPTSSASKGVIGGYSNLVRSNSYGDLRELEAVASPRKKRDRHQTLAYGVSAADLRDGMARSYSRQDLSEWRAGNVPMVPPTAFHPLSFPRKDDRTDGQ